MAAYELIAFYREQAEEMTCSARLWADFFRLEIRYEKLPDAVSSVDSLVAEHTVLCLLNRDLYSFRKVLSYVYKLSKPVLLFKGACKPETVLKFSVPVGYAQEHKEKAAWANFFQRRNPQVSIELSVPSEKDPWIAQRIQGNLQFIERVLETSGGEFRRLPFEGTLKRLLIGLLREPDHATIFLMRPFRMCSWVMPEKMQLCSRHACTPTFIIPRNESLYIPCH